MNALDTEGLALDLEPGDESPLDAAPSAPRAKIPTGTQLRHRLITPEALAAMAIEAPKPSFVQRIFGRK